MSEHQIVRWWKDPHYRASLSSADKSLMPAHPAGIVEVPDAEVDLVGGNDMDCYTMMYCSNDCGTYDPCMWTYNPEVIC